MSDLNKLRIAIRNHLIPYTIDCVFKLCVVPSNSAVVAAVVAATLNLETYGNFYQPNKF